MRANREKETLLDVINRLSADGSFELLYHYGCIGYKVFRDSDIYLHYDMLVKTRNMGSCQAITETADLYKVDERTVERAIKFMRQ